MSEITMDFARKDDCLDKMVPSDLREIIGERDRLRAELEPQSEKPEENSDDLW